MSKIYNCSFKNMCEDPDKKFMCCYYCDAKRCKYRCKDGIKLCAYKLPEGQYPPSATVQGVKSK